MLTEPQVIDSQATQPADQQAIALTHRPRRLQRTETLRRMVRETALSANDLIYPLFVMAGEGKQEKVWLLQTHEHPLPQSKLVGQVAGNYWLKAVCGSSC